MVSGPMRHAPSAVRRAVGVLLVLVAAGGCSSEFDPRSLLVDVRVLAILAEPPELAANEEVALRAVVHVPVGRTVTDERWSFCPFTAGAQAGYVCVVPACEVPLPLPAAGEPLRANPTALASACLGALAATGGEGELPPGVPTELPDTVEVVFRYHVATDDGVTRDAIQRVPVRIAEATAPMNRTPIIARVEVEGVALTTDTPGAPLAVDDEVIFRVILDEASLDDYVDAAGRDRTEEPILSAFATHGRFDEDRGVGLDAELLWKAKDLEEEGDEVLFYFAARDLRGGTSLAGPFRFPLVR